MSSSTGRTDLIFYRLWNSEPRKELEEEGKERRKNFVEKRKKRKQKMEEGGRCK